MCEETAIIIAAILGPAITLFISEFFRYRHAKREREERFFYELYPKRLNLYEEIVKEIYPVDAFEKALRENCRNDNIEAIINAAKEKAEKLNQLAYRNVLFGHSDITLVLRDFVELCESVVNSFPSPGDVSGDTFALLAPGFTLLGTRIMEFIREESGKYVVNKKIFKFFKEFKTDLRKYEKKRNHRPGPEKHPYDRDSH
jgi:hypothetical protein